MTIDDIPYIDKLPEDLQGLVAGLLLVILALVLIWVLRRVVTWLILTPLRRLTSKTGREFDDAILDASVTPMRYLVIAAAILVSAQILNVGSGVDTVLSHLGRTLIIFALLRLVYSLVDLFAPSSNRVFAITGITLDERLLPFVRTAIKLVMIAVGVVIIMQEWGYDVSGLIAGLGLGGLAFSLAAQDTVANLFGFTALVSDRPFDVGEYIKTPDVEGVVEHVGLRSTQIRRLDQSIVYVPNSVMANSAILNWSRLQKRRLDMVVGVTYDATSEQLKVLLHRLREMLNAQPTIEPDSVVVYFINFGDSSLDIMVRAYIMLADWGEFTAEKERLSLDIMDIIAELGMSVAFPSRSLYIENLPDFLGTDVVEKARSQAAPKLTAEEKALLRGDIQPEAQELTQDADEMVSESQDMPDEDAT
jgi:MscS family membrane protein